MQILELAAKLQAIGLTDKQAKVYVAALFLGPSSAQKISQQAEVNRATTYVILEELIQMGVVSQSSEGKKTVFVAEGAEAIDRHIELVKKNLTEQQAELKNLKPELETIARDSQSTTPQVFFFKGKDGVDQVNKYYRKHAKPNSTTYVMFNVDEADRLAKEAGQTSVEFRKKKNIAVQTMYYSDKIEIKSDSKINRQSKRLEFKPKADITLQEDFAILSSYRDSSLVSMVLESKDIVEALRQVFEMAWQDKSRNSNK